MPDAAGANAPWAQRGKRLPLADTDRPAPSLTPDWLRKAGLNRERILLLPARDQAAAQALACEALRLGNSHTVVSWLNLSESARRQLSRAAVAGQAQSLNIRLG